MIKVNILSPGFSSPNGSAFLFPLIKFDKNLEDLGFKISITNILDARTTDCDILLFDSKYFKEMWSQNYEDTLEQVALIANKTKLIWCDQADSTGTLLGQVLPYVHRYAKAQLLVETDEYTKPHYASRIYTDHYHRKFGVEDEIPFMKNIVKEKSDLHKLCVSWNSGLMNYGWISPYIQRIRNRIPLNFLLYFAKPSQIANSERTVDVTCRMGISYPRETVCYQRKEIRKLLQKYVKTNKLSRHDYLLELANNKICVSPYGLGEITLKDFECFLAGAMLLKPNMDHMNTWPNFYEKNLTYIAHSWDLEDIEEKIDTLLNNNSHRTAIAQKGQERYLAHTKHPNAGCLFAEQFKKIITF